MVYFIYGVLFGLTVGIGAVAIWLIPKLEEIKLDLEKMVAELNMK